MSNKVVPITIIAGFLGTGKTGLLNHLLAHAEGRRLTALVNYFGALNIDSELIAAQNGNQISLANGCVCCSIGDDLTLALAQVMNQTPRPDHILIEASGVADPARIAGFAQVDRELRLDGIITLVDALAHQRHANDPHLADNYQRQIEAGHFLLLSKTDLASAAQTQSVSQQLAAQKPTTPIAIIEHGVFDAKVLLGLNETGLLPAQAEIKHDLRQWSAHMTAPVPRLDLLNSLSTLAPHLLRAKAVLHDAEGAYVLHYAGGQSSVSPFDASPSGHFVLIGKPDMPDDASLEQLLTPQAPLPAHRQTEARQ